eukprot:m.104697 g.104697  ORF g.104697 m.104697 type:complete len:349 (-) comp27587_c0_seq1:618-1664(-)
MATARISQAPPPSLDPYHATVAFGARAIPRMKREISKTNELITIQRALMSLCDAIRDPKHIKEALDAGVHNALTELLDHEDPIVREKATESLHHFAGHAIGRESIVSNNIIAALAKLFADAVPIVRLNAHTCIERTSTLAAGATQIMELDLVANLVQLSITEPEEQIQETILDTIQHTLRFNPLPALHSHGVEAFAELLGHKSSEIAHRAARNMMGVTVPLEGKELANSLGVYDPLIGLLNQSSTPEVISSAAAALMSITVTTEGKLKTIAAGIVDVLPPLLEHKDERVLLNVIKLITVVSEAPAARKALKSTVPRLTELKLFVGQRLDSMAVSRHAQTALDSIVWTP